MDDYMLINGLTIPKIGYGTWKNLDTKECVDSVKAALELGFRHIDCARVYANEALVGQGILNSGVPREKLFIASKLRNSAHGYENVRREFEATLNDLKTSYLDLYLIHWPVVAGHQETWAKDNLETWKAFEELYGEGKVKSIGVCNFSINHLKNLVENATIAPMVNQILIHPGVILTDEIEYCRKHDILLEAYSPLAPLAELIKDETFQHIMQNHGKSPAQILIRFILELGALPLTKTIHPSRMSENLDVNDFSLNKDEMNFLESWSHPDFAPKDNQNERPAQALDAHL